MSYTREGAKKWSDQCQISAFTASVCDLQTRPRDCAYCRARGSSARSSAPLRGGRRIIHLDRARARGRTQTTLLSSPAPSVLSLYYRMLIIRCLYRCGNEQKAGITKRPARVRAGRRTEERGGGGRGRAEGGMIADALYFVPENLRTHAGTK